MRDAGRSSTDPATSLLFPSQSMLLQSTSGQGRTPVSQRQAKIHSLGSRLPIHLRFKTSFKKDLRQTLASLQICGSASRALPSALDRAFQGALSKPLPKPFCASPTAAAPGLHVPLREPWEGGHIPHRDTPTRSDTEGRAGRGRLRVSQPGEEK